MKTSGFLALISGFVAATSVTVALGQPPKSGGPVERPLFNRLGSPEMGGPDGFSRSYGDNAIDQQVALEFLSVSARFHCAPRFY